MVGVKDLYQLIWENETRLLNPQACFPSLEVRGLNQMTIKRFSSSKWNHYVILDLEDQVWFKVAPSFILSTRAEWALSCTRHFSGHQIHSRGAHQPCMKEPLPHKAGRDHRQVGKCWPGMSSETFCDDGKSPCVPSTMVATEPLKCASDTEQLKLWFHYILIKINLKIHMWLIATALDHTGVGNNSTWVPTTIVLGVEDVITFLEEYMHVTHK